MTIYTVHVPDDAPDAMTRGERTVFLREGFSLRAFVFGLLYLLWHRLWLAAAIWVVLLLALGALAVVVHPPLPFLVLLAGLMHLYLGAQGADLVRWGLARRDMPLRDLVSAPDLATAEGLFFTRRPDLLRAEAARGATLPARPAVPAVIGVFPDGSTP